MQSKSLTEEVAEILGEDQPAQVSYARDFLWQRRLLPQVKRVLAEHLIVEAPFVEDARHNTDLIVLTMRTLRVACRLRRFSYWKEYPDQITIRTEREYGTETELSKLLRGWGDYFFYGFADASGAGLQAWVLGDLGEFRLWFQQQTARGRKWPTILNADRSSSFLPVDIKELPDAFVVARAVG